MFNYARIHTALYSPGKCLAILLVMLSGLSFGWMGCGKKGPPRPPQRPLPPVVEDLRHTVEGNVVELTWTFAGAAAHSSAAPAAVKVLRATQSDEEIGCETCPIRFTAVAEIPIREKKTEQSEFRVISFSEVIEPGYRYIYKVIVFDEYGIGGKGSNLVDFHHASD